MRRFDAWEPRTDANDFQWRARLLRAIHRVELGFEAVVHQGARRGVLLPMPDAQEKLSGYLTDTIRAVVRREVEDPQRARGKLFGRPRIYNNLLSSQPLCFNIFGELAVELDLASRVFRNLTNERICEVTGIDFEYSPGRGDERYTGDRSAFDVYVRFLGPEGTRGFVGIEVKYHENLADPAATLRNRYDEVADQMGCFVADRIPDLKKQPLQQIWRDHLLVGAHKAIDGFDDAFFAFLYPANNTACDDAVRAYEGCLSDTSSFQAWTLESLVATLRKETDAAWVNDLWDRYLNFEKVDAAVESRSAAVQRERDRGPSC